MSSYVGPNGRLYKRDTRRGLWIGLTVLSLAIIGTTIVGVRNVAEAFSYIGL
jgi:hypothetical protein